MIAVNVYRLNVQPVGFFRKNAEGLLRGLAAQVDVDTIGISVRSMAGIDAAGDVRKMIAIEICNRGNTAAQQMHGCPAAYRTGS